LHADDVSGIINTMNFEDSADVIARLHSS